MTNKYLSLLLILLFVCLTGCQTAQQQATTTTVLATTSTTSGSVTTTTIAGTNIVLKGTINKRQNSLGWANFYGEVQNTGSTTVNYVKVHITMKNSSGSVIATDYGYIDGTVLATSSGNTNTCLLPGDTGAFQVATTTNYSDIASYTYLIDWETFPTTSPSASFAVVGSITQTTNYLGNREFLGEIQNTSLTNTTFVKIIFIPKDASGNVIDTSYSYVTGTDVPAGATRSFDVTTIANSTEVASYYYLIDWDE